MYPRDMNMIAPVDVSKKVSMNHLVQCKRTDLECNQCMGPDEMFRKVTKISSRDNVNC